ncbi:hypothetical protein Pelo_17946 [Pelomyxa schiedti]|nr:hypothetical protein Pelo_17946 [Pelomyxa schiedti]
MVQALCWNNTEVAEWLEGTFHAMELIASTPKMLEYTLEMLCHGYIYNIAGLRWFIEHVSHASLSHTAIHGAISEALGNKLPNYVALVLESFPQFVPASDPDQFQKIAVKFMKSNMIALQHLFQSVGDDSSPLLTPEFVAQCLACDSFQPESSKIVKWVICKFNLQYNHIKSNNNALLCKLLHSRKNGCVQWLLESFDIPLTDITLMASNPGAGRFIDLVGWKLLERHYPTIDAAMIRSYFIPMISRSPHVAIHTIHSFGITLDEFRDYVEAQGFYEISSSSTPSPAVECDPFFLSGALPDQQRSWGLRELRADDNSWRALATNGVYPVLGRRQLDQVIPQYCRSILAGMVVGFAIRGPATTGAPRGVGTVQIAFPGHQNGRARHDVLVMLLGGMPAQLPPSLKKILESPTILKCGVGVAEDFQILDEQYHIKCKGAWDVSVACMELHLGTEYLQIGQLSEKLIGHTSTLCEKTDWHGERISNKGVIHAAADAWLGLMCAEQIHAKSSSPLSLFQWCSQHVPSLEIAMEKTFLEDRHNKFKTEEHPTPLRVSSGTFSHTVTHPNMDEDEVTKLGEELQEPCLHHQPVLLLSPDQEFCLSVTSPPEERSWGLRELTADDDSWRVLITSGTKEKAFKEIEALIIQYCPFLFTEDSSAVNSSSTAVGKPRSTSCCASEEEEEKGMVVGFDTEGHNERVGTIQIAFTGHNNGNTKHDVLVLMMGEMQTELPPNLQKLLESPKILKCGVGLISDCEKLDEQYHIHCQGVWDVSVACMELHLAASYLSLGRISEELIGHSKTLRELETDWLSPTISNKGVIYAAADAWLGLRCVEHIHSNLKLTPCSSLYQWCSQHVPSLITQAECLQQKTILHGINHQKHQRPYRPHPVSSGTFSHTVTERTTESKASSETAIQKCAVVLQEHPEWRMGAKLTKLSQQMKVSRAIVKHPTTKTQHPTATSSSSTLTPAATSTSKPPIKRKSTTLTSLQSYRQQQEQHRGSTNTTPLSLKPITPTAVSSPQQPAKRKTRVKRQPPEDRQFQSILKDEAAMCSKNTEILGAGSSASTSNKATTSTANPNSFGGNLLQELPPPGQTALATIKTTKQTQPPSAATPTTSPPSPSSEPKPTGPQPKRPKTTHPPLNNNTRSAKHW